MGVLLPGRQPSLGGSLVWLYLLLVYCFLTSPLFWYLLLWRLLFIFVINLTSGASPFSWDFLYERFLLTFACNEFMAYWKVGKYLNFGFLSYVYFRPLTLTFFKLLSPGPFGFKCPDCRLSLGEVERTWSRGIVRGCFRIFFIRCFSFNLRYALNVQ